ncbi:hypothetical protein EXM22_00450 [Oceanispirochaeta crateris]|uniref:V-type ATP synthase subunit E n=1 Tax=Oceanispirochaeta crateris TaxID=2518645 RepID=A0A5C1QEP9_9SPIO|nr:V-type ATP synthase subunit E family protein [Oceanispirochaeta crateris]QEN06533.1 hypothetical protein EXM22_00450 [Oceanispirochaeta crateris]
MNDTLPELLSGISSEARIESEQLKNEALKNQEQKLASAKMLESRLIEESKLKGKKQAQQILKAAESTRSVELRRINFKREERLYAQILKEVRQRFREHSESPAYADLLVGWISEAAIGLGSQSVVIHASPGTLSLLTSTLLKKAEQVVEDQIGKKVTLSCAPFDEPDEHSFKHSDDCGVILKDQTGRLIYDNRLEARLQRYDRQIRGMIAREFLQE